MIDKIRESSLCNTNLGRPFFVIVREQAGVADVCLVSCRHYEPRVSVSEKIIYNYQESGQVTDVHNHWNIVTVSITMELVSVLV